MKLHKDIPVFLFMVGILVGLALIGATLSINMPSTNPAVLIYSFNSSGILNETATMNESTSPYWWLNSGGRLIIDGESGSTMLGTSPLIDPWRTIYVKDNPVDSDQGTHPQNLFRLVTKSTWQNVSEQADFMILRDNLSQSPNRNASNGLFLMSRYQDKGETLYYAGIRVDGTAVIKKKYKGTYYTMAQRSIFEGTYKGSRDDTNLLPHNEWITLKSETVTNEDGSVVVRLFIKKEGFAQWTQIFEALDSGQYGDTPPIRDAGYAGIRTDFMDVKFENYKLNKIELKNN